MTTTKRAPARSQREIAQAEVDKHAEKVATLTDRIARLKAKTEKAESELTTAQGDLAYAKANPRLGDPAQMSIPVDDAGGEE